MNAAVFLVGSALVLCSCTSASQINPDVVECARQAKLGTLLNPGDSAEVRAHRIVKAVTTLGLDNPDTKKIILINLEVPRWSTETTKNIIVTMRKQLCSPNSDYLFLTHSPAQGDAYFVLRSLKSNQQLRIDVDPESGSYEQEKDYSYEAQKAMMDAQAQSQRSQLMAPAPGAQYVPIQDPMHDPSFNHFAR